MVTGPVSDREAKSAQTSRDVRLAGDVQRLLLPKSSPVCSWCHMAARNRMADVLGGDFFDFIELKDGCQVLFVGDVTGHGLHASVVMSLVYGFIHHATLEGCDPQILVAELNTFLRTFAQRTVRLDHFFSATLFFAVIIPRTLTMHYVNAGHPAGLVRRAGGLIRLPATSHPVGYFDEAEFRVGTFQLEAGDRLLLYTDGLVDSTNPQGELFGCDRLDKAFLKPAGTPEAFLDALFEDVAQHLGGQPLFDDCTAIVVDFHDAMK